MNAIHIFILSPLIENNRFLDNKKRRLQTLVDVISIVVTQEGFEPPTL